MEVNLINVDLISAIGGGLNKIFIHTHVFQTADNHRMTKIGQSLPK